MWAPLAEFGVYSWHELFKKPIINILLINFLLGKQIWKGLPPIKAFLFKNKIISLE